MIHWAEVLSYLLVIFHLFNFDTKKAFDNIFQGIDITDQKFQNKYIQNYPNYKHTPIYADLELS